MALFIIYVIRWVICLTLLYSIFRLVLSRETLHSFNRLVMLTIMALSMLLPICQMEFFGGNRIANGVRLSLPTVWIMHVYLPLRLLTTIRLWTLGVQAARMPTLGMQTSCLPKSHKALPHTQTIGG